MSKKVKKGSALVVVLVFSLLFIVISGVSALAVVATLKGNGSEEGYQTLYYEAEAGIEKAIAYANRGDYADWTVGDKRNGDIDANYKFELNGDIVSFAVEKVFNSEEGEYLQVISTSKSKTNINYSRTVKAKIKNNITGGNIFKYSICGKVVKVTGGGAVNAQVSNINSSDVAALIEGTPSVTGNVENAAFTLPDLSKIPYLNADIDIECKPSEILEKLEGMIGGSIVKEEIELSSSPGIKYPIYLINIKSLNITLKKADPGDALSNAIIICTGDINLKKPSVPPPPEVYEGGGSLTLSSSLLLAKSINMDGTTMHINYPPYDGKEANLSYGILKDPDIEKINEKISLHSTNWFLGSNVGEGIVSSMPSDYE